jgi:hypothetical protein
VESMNIGIEMDRLVNNDSKVIIVILEKILNHRNQSPISSFRHLLINHKN